MPDVAETRTPLLEVGALSGGYVEGVDIVHDVDLQVFRDEILTIIGPNGAGKSTVIKAAVGALPYERGRRIFNRADASGWDTARMIAAGVGYVPQTNNVFGTMSIRENLEMGGYMRSGDVGARIDEVLELFPVLRERPRERANRLSGGQRQMLAIARALMLDPQLLCLDEPTASLSPAARGDIFALIYRIHRSGVGVVLVEQNAVEALVYSDRAVVMVNGEKVLEGTGLDLLTSDEVGRLFLGQDPQSGEALTPDAAAAR